MNSLEVRRCLVEMHAVLGEDLGFRSKEDLLQLDRDHFPSDLGLSERGRQCDDLARQEQHAEQTGQDEKPSRYHAKDT